MNDCQSARPLVFDSKTQEEKFSDFLGWRDACVHMSVSMGPAVIQSPQVSFLKDHVFTSLVSWDRVSWNLRIRLGWPVSNARDPPALPALLILNSKPHACLTSTLMPKPSPQSCTFFKKEQSHSEKSRADFQPQFSLVQFRVCQRHLSEHRHIFRQNNNPRAIIF